MKYYRIAGQFDLDYNASRVELLGEFDVVAVTDTQIALRKIREIIVETRLETNTICTMPLLSEVISRLQQEDK